MRDDPLEHRAIQGLLRHLSPPGVAIDRWPDREERNATSIDAIAGPYAIEHTCVDSFPGQSRDTSYFAALAAIEADTCLNHSLFVSVPVGALSPGQDWTAVAARIRHWVREQSNTLSLGHHSVALEGVPFVMNVWRRDESWAPGLRLGREDPGDAEFGAMLGNQVRRKIVKLSPHKESGSTTVLLLETRCGALMSGEKMKKGLITEFPGGLLPGVDQVWWADSSCEGMPGYLRLY